MSNEEILKKAIEKAIKNGWVYNGAWLEKVLDINAYEVIIFNRGFAKAFWEDDGGLGMIMQGPTPEQGHEIAGEAWEFHLQQLVLLSYEKKFKYLEKHLGN